MDWMISVGFSTLNNSVIPRGSCSREGGCGALVHEEERGKSWGEGRREDNGRDAGKSTSEHLSLLSSLQAGKLPNFRHSKAFLSWLQAACWKLCRMREIPTPKAQQCLHVRSTHLGVCPVGKLGCIFHLTPKKTISNTQHCRNTSKTQPLRGMVGYL